MNATFFGYPLTILANIDGVQLDVSEIACWDAKSLGGTVGLDHEKFLNIVEQHQLRGMTLTQRVERLERKVR